MDEAEKLRANCPICLESHTLDKLRVLPCGHSFCLDDLKRHLRGPSDRPNRARITRGECPVCKQMFKADQAIRIFLDNPILTHSDGGARRPLDLEAASISRGTLHDRPLVYSSAVHNQAAYVAHKLKEIKPDAEGSTFANTGKEIRKIVDGMDEEPEDNIRVMLKALSNMLSKTVATLALDSARQKQLLRVQGDEISEMKKKRVELEEEVEAAKSLFDQAEETAQRAWNDSKELRARVQELEPANKGLRNHCATLKGSIEVLNSKEARRKKTIAALEAELQKAREDAEDSRRRLHEYEEDEQRRKAEYESSQADYSLNTDIDVLDDDMDFIDLDSTTASATVSIPQTARFEGFAVTRTNSNPRFAASRWTVPKGTLGKRPRKHDDDPRGGSGAGGSGVKKIATGKSSTLPLDPLRRNSKGEVVGLYYQGPRTKMNKHS